MGGRRNPAGDPSPFLFSGPSSAFHYFRPQLSTFSSFLLLFLFLPPPIFHRAHSGRDGEKRAREKTPRKLHSLSLLLSPSLGSPLVFSRPLRSACSTKAREKKAPFFPGKRKIRDLLFCPFRRRKCGSWRSSLSRSSPAGLLPPPPPPPPPLLGAGNGGRFLLLFLLCPRINPSTDRRRRNPEREITDA